MIHQVDRCGCTIDAHGFINPVTGKIVKHLKKKHGKPSFVGDVNNRFNEATNKHVVSYKIYIYDMYKYTVSSLYVFLPSAKLI